MKERISFLLLFSVIIAYSACAQTLNGHILNKTTNEPVEGVNISLSSVGLGTSSDTNGHFIISNVPQGNYFLNVSMVGFVSQKVKVDVVTEEVPSLQILLSPDNRKIEEVTVVANFRQQELIEHPLRDQVSIMTSISSVTAEDIQQQGATTLTDALKYVPGAWTETRGRKEKQLFSVRGQRYPYPEYSVNGIWQKDFSEMPYFLSSSNIEEIKIVRSGSALLKSLSAITGVIDVTTKKAEKKTSDFFLKYGSLNTFHSGIAHADKKQNIGFRLAADVFGTNGPDGKNGKERIWNLNGSADWKLNEKLSTSVNAFYLRGLRQLVLPEAPADPKFMEQLESYDPLSSLLIASNWNYQVNDQFGSELQITYASRMPQYISFNIKNEETTKYKEADYELTVNQINAVALSEENTLRFGWLYNYWLAPEGKRFYYGKKGEIHTVSGVITDQHKWGKLLVDAGFRLTREYYAEWGGFAIEGTAGKFSKVAAIRDEWQPWNWQTVTGLSYQLAKSASLHSSVSSGIMNPRKGALTDAGITPGNETRINVDLGVIGKIKGIGQFTLTSFWVDRKNAIDYSGKTVTVNDQVMELYLNNDKRSFGLETEFRSETFWNLLSGFANFTWMKGEVMNKDEWEQDDEMPELIANAGMNISKKKIDFNVLTNYVGPYKNDRFVSKTYLNEHGKLALGQFITFDIHAAYAINKEQTVRVFTEMKNVSDKKYQTVAGYPDPGRIILAGLRVKI